MNPIIVPPETLQRFCADCFVKLGVKPEPAGLTAANLVFANLRGVDSHGVIRLKIYCDRLKKGGFLAHAVPEVVSEKESTALIDGQGGLGQVTAMRAMKLALQKAEKTGAAFVATRNSNHFGACAFYAMQGLDAGLIGLAATNAGATMAPSGGRERKLGNNAVAIAIPAGRHPPIVLDMATGAAAWGKIFVAQQENKKIPTSWALDKHGLPTDDPNAAADGGLIQPFGGYKGYGLSLLIDIFTGVLSGGAFATRVKTLYQEIDSPSEIAHACAAVRVESFMPLQEFRQRMDAMIDLLHACARAPGAERVFVPGEIEHETEQRRKTDGIPVNETLRQELCGLADELGVKSPF